MGTEVAPAVTQVLSQEMIGTLELGFTRIRLHYCHLETAGHGSC